jgi:hypothetical protein
MMKPIFMSALFLSAKCVGDILYGHVGTHVMPNEHPPVLLSVKFVSQ